MKSLEDYEFGAAAEKYMRKSTRTRMLNSPELQLIDTIGLFDKDVLVVGSGAGRVPSQLAVLGNRVVSVERSARLCNFQISCYSQILRNLECVNCDANELSNFVKDEFDVVFFPMNGLDLAGSINERNNIIKQIALRVRSGGQMIFSSHNYFGSWSSKMPKGRRFIPSFFIGSVFKEEDVVGGGTLFFGTPKSIVRMTENVTGFRLQHKFFDTRTRIDNIICRLGLGDFYFPYVLYVFKR